MRVITRIISRKSKEKDSEVSKLAIKISEVILFIAALLTTTETLPRNSGLDASLNGDSADT